MDGQDKYNRPSPLRNSKAVNRPFQSPLRSVLSPISEKIDHSDKRSKNSNVRFSPYNKNSTTPKRTVTSINSRPKLLVNKISQESNTSSTSTTSSSSSSSSHKQAEDKKEKEISVNEDDLKKIRDRISAKKREMEHIKRQLLYEKKHKSKDLNNLIERWLQGCQEALTEFQKDISERSGSAVEMTEILKQLGIPPKLVQYSIEDCDFM